MKSNIFIPKTIKVGFQNRSDTYTQKLAYVIYIDEKGKVQKEASWNRWRDKKIDPIDYSNEPTSGFVLNKKVGGYSSGWNHRQTYTRIYDPRGFEFEITVSNLLYILENTNSIKGKGLEGEFVYGWDGSDLILIPTGSPDYIEITEYNKVVHEKNYVKSKDLVIGGKYKSKDNSEWIYMGRFDLLDRKSERITKPNGNSSYWWTSYSYEYVYHNVSKGKHYFFVQEAEESWHGGSQRLQLLTLKSLGEKFIDTISTECVENYADLFDRLERRTEYSHYDKSKDEYVDFQFDEFKEYVEKKELGKHHWNRYFELRHEENKTTKIHFDIETNAYYLQGNYIREKGEYEKIFIGDLEKLFAAYKPIYKNEYLENGKLYRRVY